jgi:hypothetical protein
MTARNDLVGQRFTHLEVISDGGRDIKQNVMWLCRCDCGKEVLAHAYDLKGGKIISCKCAIKTPTKHGKSQRVAGKRSAIYSIWASIVNRCTNSHDQNYAHYGGRGITIDPSWRKFEQFYAEMGEPPFPKASIDRQDNDRGYSKDNCRWVTQKEQSRNTRRNVRIEVEGEVKILADWLVDLGVTLGQVHYLMRKKGCTHAEVINSYAQERRLGQS